MTQNSPNRPNPEIAEPAENPRPPQNLSFLKLQTIKLLRGAIALLEGTVTTLEADPTAPLLPPLPSSWRRLLRPIRILLPASINRKISDWGLTGAIAILSIFLVCSAIALLSPEPIEKVAQVPQENLTEIAEVPPAETEEEVAEIPNLEIPGIVETPSEETDLPPLFPSQEEVEEFESSEETITIPEPESLEPPIEGTEEEELPLTPEQILIASIEDKINQFTSKYSDKIIQEIQPNFRGSILVVKVKSRWYQLPENRQNKLADKMLDQAQSLDFSNLEIIDSQENLVARSPVVGSQMIILRRSPMELPLDS